MEEFQIPESCSVDLLESNRSGIYSHDESYEPVEVADKLEEVKRSFIEDGPCAIQRCFPVYLSIMRHLCEVEDSTKLSYFTTATNALSNLCHKLMTCHISHLNSNDKFETRNCLKMLSYVVVLMTEGYENTALKCEPTLGSRRKTRQPTLSSSVPSNWTSEKVKVLSIFCDLGDLELWRLFEPASPTLIEDWAGMVVGMAYKLLENQTITREKPLKEAISLLLHKMVTSYSQGLGLSVKVVQLLQHFEHLPTTLAGIIAALNSKTVVMETVREIGRKDPHDLAVDSSGTKAYSVFLVDLCHTCPSDVLACVSVLLPHLNGESYTFRNGVLGVIGQLLSHLTATPTLDEQNKMLRNQLFELLEEHIHDCNAFVRIKVLQIFQQLVTVQAIPLPRVEPLVILVTGRLRDKSSSVRKNALQLLTNIITNNPFAAQLDKTEFLSKLENEETNLQEQSEIIVYLRDALKFIVAMETAVELGVLLLRSKVTSDVLETLEFLCSLHQFNVGGAKEGIRKALVLIWSSEESVKQALVSVYVKLFIDSKGDGSTNSVVDQLMELVQCSSYGELASLQQLVIVLVKKELVSSGVLEALVGACSSTHKHTCQHAMQLVGMAATAESAIVTKNMQRLIQYGLCISPPDLLLAKHTCVALQMTDSTTLPSSHPLFHQLHMLLTNQLTDYQESHWIPLAEQAIKLVYKISNCPENFSSTLLKTLAGTIGNGNNANSLLLSRVLFTAGQVVFSQIHRCEVTLTKQMKTKAATHEQIQQGGGNASGDGDDMGLTGATAEDMEAELMKNVLENEVVGSGGLLAVFEKMTVLVVSNPSKYSCPGLQATACITLAKYMLASGKLCEKYLQLFFTVLEKSSLEVVRSNAVIAASDLTCRFPNLIEPWTPFIYARLRDQSATVRRTAITVLTHLILNDMVKVRGHICAMAVCLKDIDVKIVDHSQLFFHVLAKKGNALYNVLPDIISHLSDSQLDLTQDDIHYIIKYLLNLIVKDKHTENLVEKLCHRFRAVRNDLQLQNLVYCLCQLSFTERSFRKLQDNFGCYKDKLVHDEVYGAFVAILTRAKKSGAKSELISTIEELEVLFEEAHTKGLQEPPLMAAAGGQLPKDQENSHERNQQVSFTEDVLLSARKHTPMSSLVQSPTTLRHSPLVVRQPLISSEDED